MAGIEVPQNMVTATVTVEVDGTVYSTSLTAQTHKLSEIEYLMNLAWKATKEQVTNGAASAVRPSE